jgi:dTDP-4-amino-4,6-dideoxygalactose transaminase
LPAGDESAWTHYTIQVDQGRNALAEHLARAGVETRVYYPRPLHLQPAFELLGIPRGSLPVSERAAQTVLSLPLFSRMTDAQRDHVVRCVREFQLDR